MLQVFYLLLFLAISDVTFGHPVPSPVNSNHAPVTLQTNPTNAQSPPAANGTDNNLFENIADHMRGPEHRRERDRLRGEVDRARAREQLLASRLESAESDLARTRETMTRQELAIAGHNAETRTRAREEFAMRQEELVELGAQHAAAVNTLQATLARLEARAETLELGEREEIERVIARERERSERERARVQTEWDEERARAQRAIGVERDRASGELAVRLLEQHEREKAEHGRENAEQAKEDAENNAAIQSYLQSDAPCTSLLTF
jgi:hypothetical protein